MRQRQRRAATAVEFALTVPLLLTFFLASVEFARVNVLRNTVENAAYEGARRGMLPGATATECTAAAQALLDIVGIQTSTVTVSPQTIETNTETVSVTVTAPLSSSNGYIVSSWFLGASVQGVVTLPREGVSTTYADDDDDDDGGGDDDSGDDDDADDSDDDNDDDDSGSRRRGRR